MRFGESEVHALAGVDLAIPKGAFLGIVGRSGSGKSTLLNVLGGLDRPSQGQVLVEGRPLTARTADKLANARRATVGFIFQSFNLISHLTALENVALPLRLNAMGKQARRDRARELLDQVGLGGRLEHRPAELSGGERQRVAIARALANEPSMLLADEPTGNLDTSTAHEIMEMLKALHAGGERTIVLVTHDLVQAEAYCTRLVVLRDGKVAEDRENAPTGGRPAAGADDAPTAGAEDAPAKDGEEVA